MTLYHYPRINARLDPELGSRVNRLCERTGAGVSEVVREALIQYLDAREQEPTVMELFRRAGMLEPFDAPEDYSENAKSYIMGYLDKKYR